MGTLRKNQSGFGGIEALLFLVIIGIIGFTGWYVWNSKNNTDKSLSSNNSTAPIIKKATAPTTSTTDTTQYLTIKEWGVKIPLSSSLAGLTYTIKTYSDGKQSVGFTFQSLKSKPQCNADDTVGAMVRFTASDVDPMSGNKLTTVYPDATQVGTYYYAVGLPQAACTEDPALQAIVSNARKPLSDAVKNVQKA